MVAILDEDKSGKKFTEISGKPIVGTKLCVPNQIQLDKRVRIFPVEFEDWLPVSATLRMLIGKIGLMGHVPRMHYSVRELIELYNPKILLVDRDKRETKRSMKKSWVRSERDLPGLESAERHAEWRIMEYERTLHALLEYPESQRLVIRFEELVSIPEMILGSVCRFLDIPFDQKMIHWGPKYNFRYPATGFIKQKSDSIGTLQSA